MAKTFSVFAKNNKFFILSCTHKFVCQTPSFIFFKLFDEAFSISRILPNAKIVVTSAKTVIFALFGKMWGKSLLKNRKSNRHKIVL